MLNYLCSALLNPCALEHLSASTFIIMAYSWKSANSRHLERLEYSIPCSSEWIFKRYKISSRSSSGNTATITGRSRRWSSNSGLGRSVLKRPSGASKLVNGKACKERCRRDEDEPAGLLSCSRCQNLLPNGLSASDVIYITHLSLNHMEVLTRNIWASVITSRSPRLNLWGKGCRTTHVEFLENQNEAQRDLNMDFMQERRAFLMSRAARNESVLRRTFQVPEPLHYSFEFVFRFFVFLPRTFSEQ